MPDEPLDERRFAQDKAAKQRELDLREREVVVREREVSQWWRNPIIVGLIAALIGFLANLGVAFFNNRNTVALERQNNQDTAALEGQRLQSNLILEAIKTGNDPDTACQNLLLFVELGLVDDPKSAIHNTCKSVPKGPPSLPAAATATGQNLDGFGLDTSGWTNERIIETIDRMETMFADRTMSWQMRYTPLEAEFQPLDGDSPEKIKAKQQAKEQKRKVIDADRRKGLQSLVSQACEVRRDILTNRLLVPDELKTDKTTNALCGRLTSGKFDVQDVANISAYLRSLRDRLKSSY